MRPDAFHAPVTLRGQHVDLVPLELAHAPGLLAAAHDPETTRYLVHGVGAGLADAEGLVRALLDRGAAGTDLPFATVLRATGTVVGMTRYIHIDRENDSVEVGGTFLDPKYWRTPLNTDAKLVQLRHAFETERAHRVWLQTDRRNLRSQAAIVRLGAVREGLLREDRLLATGDYRTSVVYSILVSEWPAVRETLEASLRRPWPDDPARPSPG